MRQKVYDGDTIEAGQPITEGSINPHDIQDIMGRFDPNEGVQAVQAYLLSEVQKVYRTQGVNISDKHIELIIRQMLRKVKIIEPGDTNLITGSTVDIFTADEANQEAREQGLQEAEYKIELLGITKASLATESFLSAASFQETPKVLTEAAIKKKIDPLIGLKENVMIGQLIPAGTGVKAYDAVELNIDREDGEEVAEAEFEDLNDDLDLIDIDSISDVPLEGPTVQNDSDILFDQDFPTGEPNPKVE